MPELSTEDGQFKILFMLCLVSMYAGKCIFHQIYTMDPLMDKLDACTSLSRKIRLSGDTWKP